MRKPLIPAMLFLLGVTGSAFAYEIDQGPSLKVTNPNAPLAATVDPLGYSSSAQPTRTITLDKGAKSLNVTRLETVKINVAGKSVSWTFDTLGTPAFPLSKIIPGTDGITVYVAENPQWLS